MYTHQHMKAEQFAFNDQATKQGTMNLQEMDISGMVNQPFNTFWCSQRVRVGCDPDNLRLCDCIGRTITHPGCRVIQHDNDSTRPIQNKHFPDYQPRQC